jgi:hypothetical protein
MRFHALCARGIFEPIAVVMNIIMIRRTTITTMVMVIRCMGPGTTTPHSARAAAEWQTPHQPDGAPGASSPEPDLDKVEAAFVDGFLGAADPTSFLRLARVPFEIAIDDARLKLLRVEIDALTDVGSLTPHLGGGTFRYDPLPSNFRLAALPASFRLFRWRKLAGHELFGASGRRAARLTRGARPGSAYDAALLSPKVCDSFCSTGATASIKRAAALSTVNPAVSTTAAARA